MEEEVKLYVADLAIAGKKYSFLIPATSWDHAQGMVGEFGAEVVGEDVHQMSAIEARDLMTFIGTITHDPPGWVYGAEEQLEAYLSGAVPLKPDESD